MTKPQAANPTLSMHHQWQAFLQPDQWLSNPARLLVGILFKFKGETWVGSPFASHSNQPRGFPETCTIHTQAQQHNHTKTERHNHIHTTYLVPPGVSVTPSCKLWCPNMMVELPMPAGGDTIWGEMLQAAKEWHFNPDGAL